MDVWGSDGEWVGVYGENKQHNNKSSKKANK